MTVITIATNNNGLFPLLQRWLKENDSSASIRASEADEIVWTDKKIDAVTHASILDSIERHKKGDTSHLIQVNDLKEVFYDL
jgi:hypothetical protein